MPTIPLIEQRKQDVANMVLVMAAWLEGKPIQFKKKGEGIERFRPVTNSLGPSWNWNDSDYRVHPSHQNVEF